MSAMSCDHLVCLSSGSTDRPMILTLRRSNRERFQAVDATAGGLNGFESSSSRASAGVFQPGSARRRCSPRCVSKCCCRPCRPPRGPSRPGSLVRPAMCSGRSRHLAPAVGAALSLFPVVETALTFSYRRRVVHAELQERVAGRLVLEVEAHMQMVVVVDPVHASLGAGIVEADDFHHNDAVRIDDVDELLCE